MGLLTLKFPKVSKVVHMWMLFVLKKLWMCVCVCVFFYPSLDHAWKLSGGNLGIEIGTTTKREKKNQKNQKKGSPDTKSCCSCKVLLLPHLTGQWQTGESPLKYKIIVHKLCKWKALFVVLLLYWPCLYYQGKKDIVVFRFIIEYI